MTKVYANEVVSVIDDIEIVDAIQQAITEIGFLRLLNRELFLEANKGFNSLIRSLIDTDLIVGILFAKDGQSVAILTYNIVADDENHFSQGQDERGYFIEV